MTILELLEVLFEHRMTKYCRRPKINLIADPFLSSNYVHISAFPFIKNLPLLLVLYHLCGNLDGVPLCEEFVTIAQIEWKTDRILQMSMVVIVSGTHVKYDYLPLQILSRVD